MKYKTKLSLHFLFLFLLFILSVSCRLVSSSAGEIAEEDEKCVQAKILNWNLQTFFDASFDGNEYLEFRSASSGWNVSKYEQRLERLSQLIKKSDADILIFEELENKDQLHDIYNRVSGGFNLSKNYSWACFSKEEGGAIGTGILSRWPLSEVSVHALDIRTQKETQPSMRPLLKACVTVKNKKLILFANHWKSKSGGVEKSEVWRNYQEALLAQKIHEVRMNNQAFIAAGDFNRDILEFKRSVSSGPYNIVLQGKNSESVWSPWFNESGGLSGKGSYWYSGSWERIDHFFTDNAGLITNFSVEDKGPWAKEDGTPLRYYLKNGTGWSDHFPVVCTVCW